MPLFTGWAKLPQRKAFATSVPVILPLSLVSAAVYWFRAGWMSPPPGPICWAGQWAACSLGKSSAGSPLVWVRRAFGLLLLYGGVRAVLAL